MYIYLKNNNEKKKLRKNVENIILYVQKDVKEYFTFEFKLIGSGYSDLITVNEENDYFDLDYNIIIKKDKQNLYNNPKKIKELFLNSFNKYNSNYGFNFANNSKSVITSKKIKNDSIIFSFDVALMIEENDGCLYKIVFDKKNNRYIWNKVKDSNEYYYKLLVLKQDGHFNEIKKIYLDKKNKYYNKSSFSLLLEVINELWTKYGQDR